MQNYEGATFYDDAFPLLPGYEVGQMVGQGGQASVYEAQGAYGDIALKLFRQGFAEDGQRLFEAEADRAVHLRHPHIIPTYRVGRGHIRAADGGRYVHPFMTMDYIAEGSYHDRLKEVGRIEPNEAITVMRQVASALLHSQRRLRLAHLDLKPANILNSPAGAMLTDFGIARVLHTAMTTQQAMGTPAYMSPEHFTGKPGEKADVYSSAVTLYELVTGRRPFERQSLAEYLHAHQAVEPPPFAEIIGPEEAASLRGTERLVMGGLIKEAANRPGITAFVSGLQEARQLDRELGPTHIPLDPMAPVPREQAPVHGAAASASAEPATSTQVERRRHGWGMRFGALFGTGALALGLALDPVNVMPWHDKHPSPLPTSTAKPTQTGSTSPSPRPSAGETAPGWPYQVTKASSGANSYTDKQLSLEFPSSWKVYDSKEKEVVLQSPQGDYVVSIKLQATTANMSSIVSKVRSESAGSGLQTARDGDSATLTYSRCVISRPFGSGVAPSPNNTACTAYSYAEFIEKTAGGYSVVSVRGPSGIKPADVRDNTEIAALRHSLTVK